MPGDSAPIGRILAGGLRIISRLGSSPDGSLFQAQYPNGAEVTVLVPPSKTADGEPSPRDLFSRAAQIRHSNVAAVYELGEMEDGAVYVVLEQVPGEPLSDVLAEGRVFALDAAIDLALQASAGLQAAYRAGFVHGNVSPRTIIMTPVAHGRSLIKLTGFQPSLRLRQAGAKPSDLQEADKRYASPERLMGYPGDERSDVFSLGAVAHHLLTGMPQNQGQIDTSIPRAARTELETALAHDPSRRYQSLLELDGALRRVASAAAGQQRSTYQRVLRIGAVAAGLALVAGGIGQFPVSIWRATTGEQRNSSPTPQSVFDLARAPSPAPTAPLVAKSSPASQRGGPTQRATRPPPASREVLESRTDQSVNAGKVAIPAHAERGSSRATPGWAERFARIELAVQEIVQKLSTELPVAAERKAHTADDLRSDGPISRSRGIATQTRATRAPTRAPVEKRENRRIAEIPPDEEPSGYVGEPVTNLLPDSQSGSSPPTGLPRVRVAPVPRSAIDPRPRAELELDQGLRQSIGDVMRLGIAKDIAEIRPGSLRVSLTLAAMHVSSVLYNLQRLYLAYSAATQYHDDVELELRQGDALYGRFTRDGLTLVTPE